MFGDWNHSFVRRDRYHSSYRSKYRETIFTNIKWSLVVCWWFRSREVYKDSGCVDNASDGDTVFVFNDSSPYKGIVLVSKSLTIQGENDILPK
jgi:hypothetical protein